MKEPPYDSKAYSNLRELFFSVADTLEITAFRELMRVDMIKEATEFMLKIVKLKN